MKTTRTAGSRLRGSSAALGSRLPLQDPRASPTPPGHPGGGSARKAPPPRPVRELGGCRGRWHGAEGGESPPRWLELEAETQSGRGAAVRQERWSHPAVRHGAREDREEKVTRGTRGAPPPGRGGTPLPPRRALELLLRSCFCGLEEEPGGGKVLSGRGPSLPGGPARPLPADGQAGAAPPPGRRPLSPARPRALSPRIPPGDRRFPTHLPGRLRRSPLPRQRPQFTHTASGPALTLPHTQRDHGSEGAHILCVTLVLRAPRARARARRLELARGSRAGGGKDNASMSSGTPTSPGAVWEMKFRFQGRSPPVFVGARALWPRALTIGTCSF